MTYAYYERIVHRTFPAIMLRTVNSSLVVRSCAGLQIGLICLIVGLLILKTFITSTGLFRGKIQTGMDVLRVNRLFNLFHCNVASHRNQSFKKKKKNQTNSKKSPQTWQIMIFLGVIPRYFRDRLQISLLILSEFKQIN